MPNRDVRPTVFAVMPFGNKKDPQSRARIDFDHIWHTAFRPAAERNNLEAVRADEEQIGGFVHLAMYERLLLAEIVVADLTLASPNVMYELGIRHATRPKATIAVFARTGPIPFDLSPIRAIPYQLDASGALTDESRDELVEKLASRFKHALEEDDSDSPLFQLIKSYPGVTLPHDVTESFQRRVRTLTAISTDIRNASSMHPRSQALKELSRLRRELGSMTTAPTDLLVDFLLTYRDLEAFDELLTLAESFPPQIGRHPAVRQIVAFSRNRRNKPGDDKVAVTILEGIIAENGPDPETLGLLGRVHKDRHKRLAATDAELAKEALRDAISAYEKGFLVDIRDYYPGVNAVTLLLLEGSDANYRRARELSPVVAFAVAARGGITSRDYWDVATVLELAVVNLDEATAIAAASRLRYLEGPLWTLSTTQENLGRLGVAHRARGVEPEWLAGIIASLEPRK